MMMPGERQAIDTPLMADLSEFPLRPALFVLQQPREPKGVVSRPSEGLSIAHTPWYSELNIRLAGWEGVCVLYLIQYSDDSNLFFASIDQAFGGFFSLLSGADFGDELTKLVSLHWPELYAMLLHSNRRTSGQMMLFRTQMGGRVQWAVGRTIPSSQDEFPDELALSIIASAVEVSLRTSDIVALTESIPGLLAVLGGPTRGMRRLKSTGGLLTSGVELAGDIVGLFEGKPGAVEGIAGSSREILNHITRLREER